MSFYPFVLHKISVLIELILGHLCYSLTDVPPQPNSQPNNVSHVGYIYKIYVRLEYLLLHRYSHFME